MIKTLDKHYSLPSRNYFSSVALPGLYTQCRMTVEKELQNMQNFAATADLWSSRTMDPYLSLTVHFITRDFNVKSCCLQTAFFPAYHTGEELAQGLKESLSSWSLEEEKMVCTTTDSGANIVKAASLNNWTRLQCFGHRLHLAIGELYIKHPVTFSYFHLNQKNVSWCFFFLIKYLTYDRKQNKIRTHKVLFRAAQLI